MYRPQQTPSFNLHLLFCSLPLSFPLSHIRSLCHLSVCFLHCIPVRFSFSQLPIYFSLITSIHTLPFSISFAALACLTSSLVLFLLVSFIAAFILVLFHCSLISCAGKINLTVLIINKEAQLKSAAGTPDFSGKDPKRQGRVYSCSMCPLFPLFVPFINISSSVILCLSFWLL